MIAVEILIGIAVFIVGGCVGAYILLWLLFGCYLSFREPRRHLWRRSWGEILVYIQKGTQIQLCTWHETPGWPCVKMGHKGKCHILEGGPLGIMAPMHAHMCLQHVATLKTQGYQCTFVSNMHHQALATAPATTL